MDGAPYLIHRDTLDDFDEFENIQNSRRGKGVERWRRHVEQLDHVDSGLADMDLGDYHPQARQDIALAGIGEHTNTSFLQPRTEAQESKYAPEPTSDSGILQHGQLPTPTPLRQVTGVGDTAPITGTLESGNMGDREQDQQHQAGEEITNLTTKENGSIGGPEQQHHHHSTGVQGKQAENTYEINSHHADRSNPPQGITEDLSKNNEITDETNGGMT